ncbi:hypothetical protein MMC26_006384 [Xylographa opegraphella]|nr:hypothetical protein [Xylographa opegraphella]
METHTRKKRPADDLPKSRASPSKLLQKRRKIKAIPVADDTSRVSTDPQKPHLPASERVAETANTTTPEASVGSDVSSDILPPSLRYLQSQYAFATMAIRAGSKITQKVRALQTHLEKFSFVDLKAKPGVVALHAKADMVSKMISVVEIVKREAEKEGGHLYQYSRLDSLLGELKARTLKGEKGKDVPTANGKTIREWQAAQEVGVEAPLQPATNDVAMQEPGDAEEEEAFEPMTKKESVHRAKVPNSEERKKVRAIPTMTIYLSRVPVPEFKQFYGHV